MFNISKTFCCHGDDTVSLSTLSQAYFHFFWNVICIRIISNKHSTFWWPLKAWLNHWLNNIHHVLMTWLTLRSAQSLGLNPCQWKQEDQDFNHQECNRVFVRVLSIVQRDHIYGRGKRYCLCEWRPVWSEHRICGLTDHKGDKVSVCDLTQSLCYISEAVLLSEAEWLSSCNRWICRKTEIRIIDTGGSFVNSLSGVVM